MNINKTPVHYADKHIFTDATADDKIVERLTQMVCNGEKEGKWVILISADRELAQRCAEIYPIMQSSGQYLFKYCKKVIRSKYYNRP